MPFDPVPIEEHQCVRDLRAARALLDSPEKWVQNVSREDNRICARQAIQEATSSRDRLGTELRQSMAFDMFYKALGVPKKHLSIEQWNDVKGRTHAQVVDMFDRAIKIAKVVYSKALVE